MERFNEPQLIGGVPCRYCREIREFRGIVKTNVRVGDLSVSIGVSAIARKMQSLVQDHWIASLLDVVWPLRCWRAMLDGTVTIVVEEKQDCVGSSDCHLQGDQLCQWKVRVESERRVPALLEYGGDVLFCA